MSKTTSLQWFERFIHAPAFFTLRFYPLFVHRVPCAKFALDAFLSLVD